MEEPQTFPEAAIPSEETPVRPKRRVPAVMLFFLLFALVPASLWALLANKLDIRNRAATSAICWNRVVSEPDGLYWPDGCKGSPINDQSICTEALVPLTASEQLLYRSWLKAGSQQIPGCVIGAEPPGSDGIFTTPTPVACDGPDGSPCTVSSCPKCDGRRCPMVACVETEGTCRGNVCVPTPHPTSVPPRCDGPDGSTCELSTACPVCKPGQPCPALACDPQEGTCINNQCVISPVPSCAPPPPECVDANGNFTLCDPKPGVIWCKPTPPEPTKEESQPPLPEGCYEQQVQCFKAPCDPIIVCPTLTLTPTAAPSPAPSPRRTPTPTTKQPTPTPTPTVSPTIAGRLPRVNQVRGIQNILRFLFPFLSPVLPTY